MTEYLSMKRAKLNFLYKLVKTKYVKHPELKAEFEGHIERLTDYIRGVEKDLSKDKILQLMSPDDKS
jgi:hypothetical protein